jgi:hypothetical protein
MSALIASRYGRTRLIRTLVARVRRWTFQVASFMEQT